MGRFIHVLALVVVVATLGLAGNAPAAAPWSNPVSVSASANDLDSSDVAVDRNGRALVTWPALRWQGGSPHGHYVLEGWRTTTRTPGAAAFSAPRAAPAFVAGPVLFGASRAVGLDQRSLGYQRCGERITLRARFGRSSGTFGSPRTIATSTGAGGNGAPVVAANDAGIVLAAWGAVTRSDCGRRSIRVALRRPSSGSFGAPVTLRGRGLPEGPSAAVGAGGDMLVAWAGRLGNGRTTIEARYRPAGRSWGAVERLGASTVAGPLVTAIAQNGRAYVAWGSQSISESTGLRASFSVAVHPAGARRFRPAHELERITTPVGYLPRLGPVLALAGTGAFVAWTGHDTAWRVRVASTDPTGRFDTPQTVSPAGTDAALGDLAALPDGTAAVAWSGLDDERLVKNTMAAVRGPGAAFGPPELVSDGALRQPSIAIDPTNHRPTVVWPQRLGTTTSVATITAYVRASTRASGN